MNPQKTIQAKVVGLNIWAGFFFWHLHYNVNVHLGADFQFKIKVVKDVNDVDEYSRAV